MDGQDFRLLLQAGYIIAFMCEQKDGINIGGQVAYI